MDNEAGAASSEDEMVGDKIVGLGMGDEGMEEEVMINLL